MGNFLEFMSCADHIGHARFYGLSCGQGYFDALEAAVARLKGEELSTARAVMAVLGIDLEGRFL